MELFHLEASKRLDGDSSSCIVSNLARISEKIEEYISYWLVLNSCDSGFCGAVWEFRASHAVYFVLNLQGMRDSLSVGICFSDNALNEQDLRGQAIAENLRANAARSPFEQINYESLRALTQDQGGLIFQDGTTRSTAQGIFSNFPSNNYT